MEKSFLLMAFFILNFLSIFSLNQTNDGSIIEESIERKKRQDNCVNAAMSEIAANSIKVANSLVESFKDPSKIMSVGEVISSLTGSVFAFKAPSMCDISIKLDEILNKLAVFDGLKNVIDCGFSKDYIQKINNLVYRFKQEIHLYYDFLKQIID
jgi:hypothetical protein